MRFSSVLDTLTKANKRVFTTYDAAKVMGKPVAYASLMLSRSSDVARIERGKYFIKGADIYEIASNVLFPSYVSLQAGLQYYGLIDQNIIRYSVIALKRHKSIAVGKSMIEFVRAKRNLFFGYVSNANSYVADPEKLFIDCIYFGVSFSLLEEAIRRANDEGLVKASKIEDYAIRFGKKTLVNKLGFLLEGIGVSSTKLLRYRYQNYVRLRTGSNGISRKWRVVYD